MNAADDVNGRVGARVWDLVWVQMRVWDQAGDQVRERAWERVEMQVWERVVEQAREGVENET